VPHGDMSVAELFQRMFSRRSMSGMWIHANFAMRHAPTLYLRARTLTLIMAYNMFHLIRALTRRRS